MFAEFRKVLKGEISRLRHDPSTRFVLAIPLLAWLLFGYAVDIDVKSVPAVFFDSNKDAESRQLITEFETTSYFKLVGEVYSDRDLQAAIVSGRAKAGIKIPPDYSANLLSGRQGQVQVLIDGSDSMTALLVLNASQQLGFLKSLEREGITPAMFSVDVRPRLLFDSDLQSSHFYLPALMAMILHLAILPLAAIATADARASTVSNAGMLAAKLLPHTAIGLAHSVLMLTSMAVLFGLSIRGSISLVLFTSWLFLVSAFGIGIVISARARAPWHAMQWSMVAVLAPFFLSGFVFPRESMPPAIYFLSQLHPATYYLEILRGVVLRGAGIAALWDEVLALGAFAVLLTALSALCLKRRAHWKPPAGNGAAGKP
jgi:ribosome-dependent ATPase